MTHTLQPPTDYDIAEFTYPEGWVLSGNEPEPIGRYKGFRVIRRTLRTVDGYGRDVLECTVFVRSLVDVGDDVEEAKTIAMRVIDEWYDGVGK